MSGGAAAWMPEDGWQEEPKAKPVSDKGGVEVDDDLEWALQAVKVAAGPKYALPPDMLTAVTRILLTMGNGADPGERILPVGWGSDKGLERWARAYCDAHPQADLAVMYGLAAVCTMTAAQGGLVLQVPIVGGGRLDIPAIQHFMVEAESGWRKSTALNVVKEMLDRSLAAGVSRRRDEALAGAKVAIAAALAAGPDDGEGDAAVGDKDTAKDLRGQIETVYAGGVCPLTYIKDPTVEALRNLAVANGGCVAVLAGEADVFRNLTNYGTGGGGAGGSLTFFLDLWAQDSIESARVKGGVWFMRRVALNLAVLFQTEVFAEVTTGKGGADSFMSRGVFGRAWVVEAFTSGESEAGLYADDAVMPVWSGEDGSGFGVLSEVETAALNLELAWADLVAETDPYRAAMGRLRAWDVGVETAGSKWRVPRMTAAGGYPVDVSGDPMRRVLTLDESGLLAYRRLQRMAAAIKDAVDGGSRSITGTWSPVASRIVQHVLRDALATTLAAGGRQVTGEAITDAAVRVLPWRWGMQAAALGKRAHEIAEIRINEEMARNPKGEDRDPEAAVRAALCKLGVKQPGARAGGFTWTEIFKRAEKRFSSTGRESYRTRLFKALLTLVAEDPDVSLGKPRVNPINGKSADTYVISAVAVSDWAKAGGVGGGVGAGGGTGGKGL